MFYGREKRIIQRLRAADPDKKKYIPWPTKAEKMHTVLATMMIGTIARYNYELHFTRSLAGTHYYIYSLVTDQKILDIHVSNH